MSSYRALKAKETAVALLGLEERLTQCPCVAGEHAVVLEKLEGILARLFAKLEQIAPLAGDPAFHSHVDLELNYISSYLSVIELQFVRALQTPSKEELYLRAMFLRLAERLGINWFEDMVLHTSGKLGIYQELDGSLATPVIHVPGGFLDKFLSLPGVYHEFGHSVFAEFPSILGVMLGVVRRYFDELRHRLGPTQPESRYVQLKRFQDAEDFWNDRRLEELFCDLFAQYLCGCANIISMIDLSMAEGRPVSDTGDLDYPPDGARVRACAMMLNPDQAGEASMHELQEEWEDYAQQFNHSLLFRDSCAEPLLRELGQSVFAALAAEMPALRKCDDPLPDVKEAFVPSNTVVFEKAIQQGFAVLAWRRDNFESWWKDVRTRLV
jgi:hypothetical protein